MSESKLASFEYYRTDEGVIYHGHALDVLRSMPDESVQCCVSSPPYWGLRDYGLPPMIWDAVEGCRHEWFETEFIANKSGGFSEKQQSNTGAWNPNGILSKHGFCQLCGCWRGCLGLEPTLELFISHIVEIFREVRRILRSDGTLFLNLGDSYAGGGGFCPGAPSNQHARSGQRGSDVYGVGMGIKPQGNLKPKDLCGIPWRVAFALQADGWFLRSAMPWVKRSSMPESVTDRPASALEYVFLLAKSQRYFFDMDAIKKKVGEPTRRQKTFRGGCYTNNTSFDNSYDYSGHEPYSDGDPSLSGRNFRNTDIFFESLTEPFGAIFADDELVGLDINPEAMKAAHFATFPRRIPEIAILAGTSEKGCCCECGKPWERVVEKTDPDRRNVKSDYPHKQTLATLKYKHDSDGPVSRTIGWQPGCKCNADTVPCVIMDPFFGSGTVGIVAHKHGRKFIGIELSEIYLKEIAIPRIQKETRQLRLFN